LRAIFVREIARRENICDRKSDPLPGEEWGAEFENDEQERGALLLF
jgi:hypothetical protein